MIDHCAEEATLLFLLPKCDKSQLMAVKRISMSFQYLSDLYSLIASQPLYSGWPASCEKHTNGEYLIPSVILGLSNSESRQNENCLSLGRCITEQNQTGGTVRKSDNDTDHFLWKLTGCYCLVKRSFCCTTLLSSKVIVPFFLKLKHWFCKVKNECFRCYFLRPYISVLAVPPEERINNDKYWLGSPAEFHVQRRWECLIGSYCAPSKTVDCLIYTHAEMAAWLEYYMKRFYISHSNSLYMNIQSKN